VTHLSKPLFVHTHLSKQPPEMLDFNGMEVLALLSGSISMVTDSRTQKHADVSALVLNGL